MNSRTLLPRLGAIGARLRLAPTNTRPDLRSQAGPRVSEATRPAGTLNIAIVCDAVTDCLGGALMATNRFAERLVERGHEVIYITGKSPQNADHGRYGSVEVFRFRSVAAPYFDGQFYLGLPTPREVEEVLRGCAIDIVHVVLPSPSGLAATSAARRLGIPVVMHSHMAPEVLFLNMPDFVPKGWLNALFFRYAHWYYGRADAVVFPTEHARGLFSGLPGRCETHVISNGVDAQRFVPGSAGEFFEKFAVPRGRKNLLYVGRLHPEKSVQTLVEAAPRILEAHPDTQIFIVGAGSEQTSLERLTEKLGLASHVVFFGRLTGDDLLNAFNASDVLVLPSRVEIEPLVALEAMACGKPLLVSDGWPSGSAYIANGCGVSFRAGDPADLAATAARLLGDPALLARMGQRGRESSSRFDIRQSVTAIEALYRSLLRRA